MTFNWEVKKNGKTKTQYNQVLHLPLDTIDNFFFILFGTLRYQVYILHTLPYIYQNWD